ncbi:MAG: hypothetical protein IPL62_11195 [Caulobacteraceae bacterium]|nr:hypothetical protein [Caulobacteraceae bacterium]MBP6689795.1 hypothetical protein [Hyphomonadaceae bacterium]
MNTDFRSIRKILWEDWDPIGCGVPKDEYDDYVGPVLRLLVENKPALDVANYLRATAAETIACPVSEEKIAAAVGKLMALRREQ